MHLLELGCNIDRLEAMLELAIQGHFMGLDPSMQVAYFGQMLETIQVCDRISRKMENAAEHTAKPIEKPIRKTTRTTVTVSTK